MADIYLTQPILSVSISALSAILLLMGLAGVAGTWAIGHLLEARLYSIVNAIPLVMALLAGALILLGSMPEAVTVLLIGWGFFGTAAPVGWGTWLSRTLRDDAEAGGGLQVAVIQLAITLGAAAGGLLFDALGWWSAFALGSVLLLGSALAAAAAASDKGKASA